ncbi:hypothetical protein ANCDUO_03315 [Ancylostoma duodenale]|uniref:Uncharacterized protein n=1 Tax=Ancylostoma duodenale TaxID=51022 RepID=A0A0C2HA55_9BILA|nr:hypothetical protein ANCDUO_03315 [Ancylostoma duodenale]
MAERDQSSRPAAAAKILQQLIAHQRGKCALAGVKCRGPRRYSSVQHLWTARSTSKYRGIKVDSSIPTHIPAIDHPHDPDRVRLLDETGIELLHHTTIKAKDMKKEIIDGKVVYFGEYNFTGLEE